MRFENKELKTTFEAPERPTYRQMLDYDTAVEFALHTPTAERLWAGVTRLAQNWQSEIVQLDQRLDQEMADYRAVSVMKWAGLALFSHVLSLREIDPN